MVKNGNDPPNAFTISSVLKACKGMERVFCGRLVHGLAIKRRFMKGFIYVDNALMDMYASCAVGMREACVVFHDIKGEECRVLDYLDCWLHSQRQWQSRTSNLSGNATGRSGIEPT
ncbi:hypothetical protein OIU84_018166 [Salix udensis]|uniref:Uncharacterized protein n=1 Tax=Salix udensis TaxID=889485 RepID=A0AAD6L3S5_9ROSI|nr:hypothetical protein OIU84_018166 [Salix udensis]